MSIYRQDLKQLARGLRSKMTEAEVKFWIRVRQKQIDGLRFYRQRPLGKYIVDFYRPAKKMIVEIDGGQHYGVEDIKNDLEREKYFADVLKLKIIRFANTDILKNIDGVIARLKKELITN